MGEKIKKIVSLTFSHSVLLALLARYFYPDLNWVRILSGIFLIFGSVLGVIVIITLVLGAIILVFYMFGSNKMHFKGTSDQSQATVKSSFLATGFSYVENMAICYLAFETGWYILFIQAIVILSFTLLMAIFKNRLRRKIAQDMLLNFRAEDK